ncbi:MULTISPECIES: hypothetical protein [Clostridium]|uniref:hypothetical protein n=1 Tax=Clostridium TaxID=1485 RepID=UPI000983D7F2|nr:MULTISPECIES: hypothetical protein [Clostridium]AQR98178.1 hypothetical protein CLSAP_55330 [Clostridium saccharoperbutylacetonicum]NSB34072.1 heme A synthase [Clostridium saccharoperbutylacetonicum]
MGSKARTLASIGIGFIVFIVTLVVFFLGYTNHPMENIDWIAFIFVLISEILLFGGTTIILMKKYPSNQMLLVSGIISTLSIYWIVTCILSIFNKNIFNGNTQGFITTQIIILAAALIISIALYVAGINVNENDDELAYSGIIIKDCESLAFSLKSNSNFSAYSSLLNKIYEEIKYSDKTKTVENEQIIYNRIQTLKELLSTNENNSKIEDVSKLVDEIVLLIKERNQSVLKLHQGGF